MRLRLIGVFLGFWVASFAQSSKNQGYVYTVDITKVVKDKVHVELIAPPITTNEIIFYLPKIVPGTYDIADYGRYVSEFTATDKKGKKLEVEKIDDNSWKIKGATRLNKISYWVDDTIDTPMKGPEIFQPAGTNIEDGKNFIMNSGGFYGYFDGMKNMPFQFNIIRPKDLYGTTGLIAQQTGKPLSILKLEKGGSNEKDKLVDVYKTSDYDQLVDSPVMYAKPDTAVIHVANAEVLVGAYSPTGKINAKQIAASIREVLMAQKEFLGGKLPVDKYAFIFYFTDKPLYSYGALEHSYSSTYYMPEMTIDQINQQLRDFAAHEFFHIITPLGIHSEEIGHFDFNHPKMSQHLWMYEGVTEYFAGLVQLKYDLIDLGQYLEVLYEKMVTADPFKNDVPFTEISKFTLDKYNDQYYNVYQKGPLIGLCLDVKLRKLSGGKYGLQNLMLELSKKFGKDKAFEDDQLFDEITRMTYPEIGTFFDRYVKGAEPLPIKETLQDIGILYAEEASYSTVSLGIDDDVIGVEEVEGKQRLKIISTDNMNAVAKALGFQKDDILIKMNGEVMPDVGPDFEPFLKSQFANLGEGKTLAYTVWRKDEKGKFQTVELSTPNARIEITRRHIMEIDPDATPEQLALRDAWMKP